MKSLYRSLLFLDSFMVRSVYVLIRSGIDTNLKLLEGFLLGNIFRVNLAQIITLFSTSSVRGWEISNKVCTLPLVLTYIYL